MAPEKLDAFLAVVNKWDVETSVLGEVTGDGRLQIFWHGEEIVNVDPSTVAVDGPVYERPVAYPTWIDALRDDSAAALTRDVDPDTMHSLYRDLLAPVAGLTAGREKVLVVADGPLQTIPLELLVASYTPTEKSAFEAAK